MQPMRFKNFSYQLPVTSYKLPPKVGFTVIEVVVAIGITTIVITALLRFISLGHPLAKITYLQAQSTEAARLQLKRMSKQLREVRYSATGAYPLVEVGPQRLIVYADIDRDATVERIRYELVGTDLVRGIVEPTGNPLTYTVANEVTTTLTRAVRNDTDPIFTYYTGDYPADPTALTPTDLTEVKYIQFFLRVDVDPNVDPPPIDVRSQVQLRNLKTNLGEVVE